MQQPQTIENRFVTLLEVERRRLKRAVAVLDAQRITARHVDDKESISWDDLAEVVRDMVLESIDKLAPELLAKEITDRLSH